MTEFLRQMRSRNTPADVADEPPFDASMVQQIENDLAEVVQLYERGPRDYAPPAVRQPLIPLPDYVHHAEAADDITRITGHAVIQQHELCAKAIEAMREPLTAWADALQQGLEDIHGALALVDQTAQRCRELGASAFDRVQKSAGALTEVRRVCTDVCSKIDPTA